MMRCGFLTLALGALPLALALAAPQSRVAEVFEKSVRPVLAAQCLSCHGATQQLGGVRLDQKLSKDQAQKLIAAIGYEGKIKMPPSGKLPESERTALTSWAQSGALAPPAPKIGGARVGGWPYSPVKLSLAPPVVEARTDIDAFLLARLKKSGLGFAPKADKRTLIRRLSFDLTGLPPTPERVEAFVRDTRPDAYEKLTDELLASSAYGERWGRHWLDVARYADSADARGLGSEGDISEAWRYRDWVIGALNADMPYTEFIKQQLAGDVLSGDPVPTGFLAIGNWGNGDADKDKILTDIADDQVDMTSRAFLGLTVGCARCHDHKFDPIPTRDYYAMAGIFFSSHILPKLTPKGAGEVMLRIPLETSAQKAARKKLAVVEKQLEGERTTARKAVALAWAREAAQGKIPTGSEHHWQEFLALDGPPTLRTAMQRVGDIAGIDGVKGDKPAVSATVNTTNQAQRILTFTLPARSVNVHPSPNTGVAAVWKATRSGTFAVEATLADADPACGDGFAWELRQGEKVLASGKVANGAAAPPLKRDVTVMEGETLLLCVLPGGEYSCDTTTIGWKVGTDDLTADALTHAGQGSFGPWRFVDLGPTPRSAEASAVIAAWKSGDHAKALTLAAALPVEQSPFLPDSDSQLPTEAQTQLAALEKERAALQAQIPAVLQIANGIAEGGVPGTPHDGVHDVKVHKRGRYDNLGELVPRGAPVVLGGGAFKIASGSGRRELAEWIASERNPMTARVIANRLWQGHFGRGIVATPSNFGALGEKPTHPELLDYLARELVQSGWSLKALHKRIVTSDAYQQFSVPSSLALAKDPDNRLLSRAPRRRLEAEALRDALLSASGKLDHTPGGLAFRDLNVPRRTVYAMTIRSDRTGFGPLFDSADPTNSAEKRTISTVAPQALYLLNSPFALEQAQALAARLKAHPGTDSERIAYAYKLLYARPQSAKELALGQGFLTKLGPDGWDAYAQALLCANEFCYVD
ncbi:DUF1553 domain-containing protein [Armatimonas sp.]|uniref:DUF1549 and DUF1553 domain-containing protein n=1 Tax=Armatimonas sp. TaxID=1872638 RepID=UPI00286C2F3E|nr:DUF1553 domain-containing protein [Armatimonas sp.]